MSKSEIEKIILLGMKCNYRIARTYMKNGVTHKFLGQKILKFVRNYPVLFNESQVECFRHMVREI